MRRVDEVTYEWSLPNRLPSLSGDGSDKSTDGGDGGEDDSGGNELHDSAMQQC